jgi:hypothetical protein
MKTLLINIFLLTLYYHINHVLVVQANTSVCSALIAKVCILFDRSKSLSEDEFYATRDRIIQLTNRLNVVDDDTGHSILYAMMTYENSPSWPSNQGVTLSSVSQKLKEIENIKKLDYNKYAASSGTKLSFALKFVKSKFFDPTNSVQTNAPKILVIFTDGLYENGDLALGGALDMEINNLRNSNVNIIALSTSAQSNYENLERVSTMTIEVGVNFVEFFEQKKEDFYQRLNAISIGKCQANVFGFVQNYIDA